MKLLQRQFFAFGSGAAALPAVSPMRLIVGFPAAGPNDILARLMGQWLSERLGQTFVVETRTGAGGNVGTEAVVKAPPNGYTLLHRTPSTHRSTTISIFSAISRQWRA
jgi:tripartite-type tricarboxylate transporter receptor subunit TctC